MNELYQTGYKDGFYDGVKAGLQCRNCEYIGKCEDDPQKTDYCPNSMLRQNSLPENAGELQWTENIDDALE